MLYFYCAKPQEVKSIRDGGLYASGASLPLLDRLEGAQDRCRDMILVIDAAQVEASARRVPPDAVLNAEPYLEPKPVTAGGGFVTRQSSRGLELLLIFRRGRWDLPKGKLDKGETIEECALREVQEELGIDDVRLERALGSTVHGYPEKGKYMVKTTHWFEMSTSAESFSPQSEEDIESVRWTAWGEARARLGYKTLQQHLDRVAVLVNEPTASGASDRSTSTRSSNGGAASGLSNTPTSSDLQ